MATIRILCVERVDLLFFLYKKYKKERENMIKMTIFRLAIAVGVSFLGGEYDILSLNREEKTSSHQENNT